MNRAIGRHWTAVSSTKQALAAFHIFLYIQVHIKIVDFYLLFRPLYLLFSLVKMSSSTLGTLEACLLASSKKLSLVSLDEIPCHVIIFSLWKFIFSLPPQ